MDIVIMQIAIAEMVTFPNIPASVSINEYVDLAKLYSTPQSGRYVNGMLDTIARTLNDMGVIFKPMEAPKPRRQFNNNDRRQFDNRGYDNNRGGYDNRGYDSRRDGYDRGYENNYRQDGFDNGEDF